MATFLQLSDLHLVGGGRKLYGTIDSAAQLRAGLDRMLRSGIRFDAILVTGDVADHGADDASEAAKHLVDEAAAQWGCPVVWLNGNHDEKESFRRHFLAGGDLDRVVEIAGTRFVALDSCVPGENHGGLSDTQLAWLDEILHADARGGEDALPTIVLLHHPPIHSPIPNLDRGMLRNPERLAAVLRNSGVQMVLSGHAHYTGAGSCGGVPVWVCGSTSAYSDSAPPAGRARAAAFSTCSRIDVINGEVIATELPLCDLPTALDFQAILDGEMSDEKLREMGIKAGGA